MKSCSTCGDWKRDAHFYIDRRGRSRDGLHHACKDCERIQAAARQRMAYIPKNTMRQRRDEGGRFVRRLYA